MQIRGHPERCIGRRVGGLRVQRRGRTQPTLSSTPVLDGRHRRSWGEPTIPLDSTIMEAFADGGSKSKPQSRPGPVPLVSSVSRNASNLRTCSARSSSVNTARLPKPSGRSNGTMTRLPLGHIPCRSGSPQGMPSARTLMLAGFRSRWMTPCSCAASRASAICLAMGNASSTGIGPCFIRSASVGPSTSSRTSAFCPSASSSP